MSSPTQREGFAEGPDGTKIFYEVWGNGPALVLCDGILCEGYVWRYLRQALEKSFTLVHWNYRGHGRSGRPKDPACITIRDHALDLWSVLDTIGIERAAVAGHSMGSQVCLEAYRARPEKTLGLVLLCGSYGKVTRTFHGTDLLHRVLPTVLATAKNYPRVFRGMVGFTPARLALWVAKVSREIDPVRTRAEDMLPYFEHLNGMDPELFLAMLQAAGDHSAEDLLPTIKAPALVVAGELDTFTPPRLAEQMARQIPTSEFLLIREGSHSVPIEQHELVDLSVEKFLFEHVFPTETNDEKS